MSRFVRSGGSFNYVCGKAETWFKSIKPPERSFGDTISTVADAYAIADNMCAILGLPLHQVISQAHGRLTATTPLLVLHPSVERQGAEICKHIPNDSTRWTMKSRSQWGYRLLRFIATLARTRDLNLLQVMASPAPVDSADPAGELQQGKLIDKSKQKGLDIEPEAGSMEDDKTCLDIFRAALAIAGDNPTSSDSNSFLPHNYGLDLHGLRRLTNLLLGTAKQRSSISHHFEPAMPIPVKIDLAALTSVSVPPSRSNVSSVNLRSAAHSSLDNGIPESSPLVLFPLPQWHTETQHSSADWDKRYKAAVMSVKRKKITVLECDHTPCYDYGVLRRAEDAFGRGQSIIVTGISGTGKSTFLTKLPTLGATVFEVGTDNFIADPTRLHYRMNELNDMLKKARRTPGRKLFICHEFFICKEFIPRLGIFDQFAIAGDPKQPGAGDAQHLFAFIRDIGGLHLTLPVVWRVGNPLSTMVVNYFAYGSQFRICERRVTADDPQFQFIESDESIPTIAKSMVVYALEMSSKGKSTIIAASCTEIVASVQTTIRSLRNPPAKVQCRLLSDLQGREADTLVFDLHDVATCYPDPDDAIRYSIMLLGRARLSICIVLRKRQHTNDITSVRPAEVIFGVLLRFRLRSREKQVLQRSGSSFEQFSRKYELFLLDEETIRVRCIDHFQAGVAIVKSRQSHNVAMIKDFACVIEASHFFESGSDLDRDVSTIEHLLSGTIPKGIYSMTDIQEYIATRPPKKA